MSSNSVGEGMPNKWDCSEIMNAEYLLQCGIIVGFLIVINLIFRWVESKRNAKYRRSSTASMPLLFPLTDEEKSVRQWRDTTIRVLSSHYNYGNVVYRVVLESGAWPDRDEALIALCDGAPPHSKTVREGIVSKSEKHAVVTIYND